MYGIIPCPYYYIASTSVALLVNAVKFLVFINILNANRFFFDPKRNTSGDRRITKLLLFCVL